MMTRSKLQSWCGDNGGKSYGKNLANFGAQQLTRKYDQIHPMENIGKVRGINYSFEGRTGFGILSDFSLDFKDF